MKLKLNWNRGQIRLFLKLLLSHLISIEWNWNWLEIDLKLRANKTLAQIAIYSFNIEWMKLKLIWNRGQIRLLHKLLLSHLISIFSAKVDRVENNLVKYERLCITPSSDVTFYLKYKSWFQNSFASSWTVVIY